MENEMSFANMGTYAVDNETLDLLLKIRSKNSHWPVSIHFDDSNDSCRWQILLDVASYLT